MRYIGQLTKSSSYNWQIACECGSILTSRRAVWLMVASFFVGFITLHIIWDVCVVEEITEYKAYIHLPDGSISPLDCKTAPSFWHYLLQGLITQGLYRWCGLTFTGFLGLALIKMLFKGTKEEHIRQNEKLLDWSEI